MASLISCDQRRLSVELLEACLHPYRKIIVLQVNGARFRFSMS